MKHSVLESFDYNCFSKEDLYDIIVELQNHAIEEKSAHIETTKQLLLAKKELKTTNIELEFLKNRKIEFNNVLNRIKKKRRKAVDFSREKKND